MNPKIISLVKQFKISVLSSGKFAVYGEQSGVLSNEEYLLEVLRAERLAREEHIANPIYLHADGDVYGLFHDLPIASNMKSGLRP